MKRFLMAAAMTCVFAGSVLAGEIPTVDAPAPASASSGTYLAGDMPGVDRATASSGAQSSAVVTVLLTIIRVVVR